MPTPVTMPVLGLTMEEGTVAEWLKREGDVVERDEPLLTVEMDKGTLEVPSPASGVLRRIVVHAGATVPVRTLIAEIGEASDVGVGTSNVGVGSSDVGVGSSDVGVEVSDAAAAAPSALAASTANAASGVLPANVSSGVSPSSPSVAGMPGVAAGGPGDLPPREATGEDVAATELANASATDVVRPGGSRAPSLGGADAPGAVRTGAAGTLSSAAPGVAGVGAGGTADSGPTSTAGSAAATGGPRLMVSPRARLRARELGIELGALRGIGPHGRIMEADVLAVAREAPRSEAPRRRPVDGPTAAGSLPWPGPLLTGQAETVPPGDGATADVQPLTRLRRITAERMIASAQTTARVTLFVDADFSEATRFRAQLEPEFARLGVARLPWDAIIGRAAALALAEHRPMLAQWVEGQGLRQPSSIHVGVAVMSEDGLVVPVLRDADRRSLRDLAVELLDLVARARSGRLSPTEMQGGGFSITNLGAYRIDGFTPLLKPPETAILGVGRIAEKPVVVDGSLTVRTQCTLSLSFDHRVVDGAPAAAFLARLAELLERPYALLGI